MQLMRGGERGARGGEGHFHCRHFGQLAALIVAGACGGRSSALPAALCPIVCGRTVENSPRECKEEITLEGAALCAGAARGQIAACTSSA